MAFLKHEACPNCRSVGKDREGNNLARYTNGSAFCFSCRYTEWPDRYSGVHSGDVAHKAIPKDLTDVLPRENQGWLEQYLESSEIRSHFKYSPSIKRHIFQDGTYWEARSVLGAKPKTISHGDKPFILFGTGDPIVVVEDVVSAIKVSRVCTAIPLFGNSLPPEWMVRICKLRPQHVGIWLDSNMVLQARKIVKKFNLLAPIAGTVETELDPKCYTTEQIKGILCLT